MAGSTDLTYGSPKGILDARLLVVDDQQANVHLLERMLQGAGYRSVSSTLDPGTVCELHRANHYDLILLDLQMPGMDGFEVMEQLKEIEEGGYLPVLVITAQPDHKLRALKAGAKDFVSKPIDLAEVLTRVHNMLEVRLYAKSLKETVVELEASRELIRGQNDQLKKLFGQVIDERKGAERLALRMPPSPIAERLPAHPDATADSFAEATVLIADVVGLSRLIPAVSHEQLGLMVDEIFSGFDALAGERGLKKIKTIGNSYMAAGGVPLASPDHAPQAAQLALDMIDSLARFNERSESKLQVRIGLSTGPVVAGVVGRRSFLHDLWGEAVNTASVMESSGVAGRVQVSESTRHLLAETFLFEARGAVDVPGGGELKTWFLTGRSNAGPT